MKVDAETARLLGWDAIRAALAERARTPLGQQACLTLAALGLVRLPSRLVESIIALSIIVVALNNVFPRFRVNTLAIIFFFGLFHGMFEGNILTFNPGLTNRMERIEDYLDVLVSSVVDNGGRSCINASAIVVPRRGAEVAEALLETDTSDEPNLVVIQTYITSAYRSYQLAEHYRKKGFTDAQLAREARGVHAAAAAEGITHVIVNGVLTLQDGQPTGHMEDDARFNAVHAHGQGMAHGARPSASAVRQSAARVCHVESLRCA